MLRSPKFHFHRARSILILQVTMLWNQKICHNISLWYSIYKYQLQLAIFQSGRVFITHFKEATKQLFSNHSVRHITLCQLSCRLFLKTKFQHTIFASDSYSQSFSTLIQMLATVLSVANHLVADGYLRFMFISTFPIMLPCPKLAACTKFGLVLSCRTNAYKCFIPTSVLVSYCCGPLFLTIWPTNAGFIASAHEKHCRFLHSRRLFYFLSHSITPCFSVYLAAPING